MERNGLLCLAFRAFKEGVGRDKSLLRAMKVKGFESRLRIQGWF